MPADQQVMPDAENNNGLPQSAEAAPDIDALRTAIAETASTGATLWLSYMFLLFYFLIAVGGVQQRDLLLETPVKLPFMNVDLPLRGFFWLGPLIFLLVHGYTLVHFVFLAQKIQHLDTTIQQQKGRSQAASVDMRWKLPGIVFVQLLAGPEETRHGFTGVVLWVIALVSLVIGPLCLLLFFQLAFLAYHHQAITWWQRSIAGLDLLMLWFSWPRIASAAWSRPSRRQLFVAAYGPLGGLTFVALAVLLLMGTFPGESLEHLVWDHTKDQESLAQRILDPARRLLVAGQVDPTTRRPTSLFSNRIVAPGVYVRISSDNDLPHAGQSDTPAVSLRGRNLRSAVLIDAVLEGVDFTAADLGGAHLENARLRKAQMGCADPVPETDGASGMVKPEPDCVNLQGATLNYAQMQGAILTQAHLEKALFTHARMQAADLSQANMAGAYLTSANLAGADLHLAKMQDSRLENADLEGANLDYANLQSAVLTNARLLGASLNAADLQGAQLQGTRSGGASLRNVRLESSPAITPAPPDPQPDQGLQQLQVEKRAQQADPSAYEAQAAQYWKEAGCAVDGGPFVADKLTHRLVPPDLPRETSGTDPYAPEASPYQSFAHGSRFPAEIASAFLDHDCMGTRNLEEGARSILGTFASGK